MTILSRRAREGEPRDRDFGKVLSGGLEGRQLGEVLEKVEADLRTSNNSNSNASPKVEDGLQHAVVPFGKRPDPLSPKAAELLHSAITASARELTKEAQLAAAKYLEEASQLSKRVDRWCIEVVEQSERLADDIAAHHAKLRAGAESIDAAFKTLRGEQQDRAAE